MVHAASKLVILLLVVNFVGAAVRNEDEPSWDAYDSTSNKSSDTVSTDVEPAPPTALGSLGPLLSLVQPIIGSVLNGPGSETDPGPTYPPLLQPLFSPLPLFPGLGIIPSTLAAQASDLLASAALSARMRFANAAQENSMRSQRNFAAILDAINDLNNPTDNPF